MHHLPTNMKSPIASLSAGNPGPKSLNSRHPWAKHVWVFIFFTLLFSTFYAPALLTSHLLAPGDGLRYYLPHYEMPHTLWDPSLMTGFPEMADPQLMSWYAPALLLSALAGSWNCFVISAYVLASWFTYLYLWRVIGDGFAAIIGGTVYGLSGFMMAHLGHTTIIHAAAWIPAILLAVEELLRAVRVRWILIGGVITSQCLLAGHPQIALYGLALAGAYVVVGAVSARKAWLLKVGMSAAMISLALLLSAIQLVPTAQLAAITPRSRLSFSDFSQFSLSVYDLILLAFPCLFGGAGAGGLDGIPFFAAWNISEVSGYVGLSALVFAAIGVVSLWRNWKVSFWFAAGLFALFAAMGPTTPVGHLVYLLPGFGQFRAQGRFIGVFCLAMAILAGYGVSSIRSRSKWARDATVILGALLLLLTAAFFVLPAFEPQLRVAAAAKGIASFPVSITGNRWVRLPVISGLAATAVLLLFRWRPRSRPMEMLLIASIICELGLFGWFGEWRYWSPNAGELRPRASAQAATQALTRSGGRWLAVRGYLGREEEAPPDLSALWNLPSIGKYGPLLPTRYSDLLEISSNGLVLGNWWDSHDRALDLVGARMLALPASLPNKTITFRGLTFPVDEMNIVTGNGCGAARTEEHISLPHSIRASSVGIVSLLGCSVDIAQGTPTVLVRMHGKQGAVQTVSLKAGIDTAEWAAACADVAPVIRHQAATVFSRFSVPRGGGICQAQQYATIVNLPKGAMDVESLDFEWLPKSQGVSRIVSLAFADGTKQSGAVRQTDVELGDASRWKEFRRDSLVAIYENLRALPRSWVVPKTLPLDSADIKRAIQTSRLPDGSAYDPRAVALIEEPLRLQSPHDPEARAEVIRDANTSLEVHTSSRQAGFLVLGDFYFPGWRVYVNGIPSHIYQTNYVQRGVLLPAGNNRVLFEFRPLSFYAGLGVSSAGILLSILTALFARRRGIL
jgi:hypothetical protein